MAVIQKRPCQITIAKAIIRPTGLLDPEIILKPVSGQVDDILEQIRQRVSNNQRVIITTLTKKFAEELDEFLKKINIKSAYIHSGIDTLDRLDIISDLRQGKYDVLIGVNLLREGLDLPEVSLVAIFDADREGFLRSKTSLIQIIGRAARHTEGCVIMYADKITESMRFAIDETNQRRELQMHYNQKHGVTPKNTKRELNSLLNKLKSETEVETQNVAPSQNDAFDEMIENRFATRRHKRNRKSSSGQSRSTKEIYEDFGLLKTTNFANLSKQNLSVEELSEKLQIAINAMDFEMAAAIQDIIKTKRK